MSAAAETAARLGLSVVVTATRGGRRLESCLAALAAQQAAPPFEIVVAVDPSLGGVDALRVAHPEARFVEVDLPAAEAARSRFGRRARGGGSACAQRRATGLWAARALLVALTDDRARADPSWCARIAEVHARLPHAALGGAVECASPASALAWALYFCEFGPYQNPLPEGPARSASALNVTYKRAALDRVRATWGQAFRTAEVHAALAAAGERLWRTPALVVVVEPDTPGLVQALRERFARARAEAASRAHSAGALRRALALARALLRPAWGLAAGAATALRRRRHAGAFARALPLLALLLVAGGAGEALGHLTARAGSAWGAQPGE